MTGEVHPGEVLVGDAEIELNAGRRRIVVTVANSGDRPIQIGSHYHFAETNGALRFDRDLARGFRLDIPAGTAVRFEPGQERTVELVELGGARIVYGFAAAVMGPLEGKARRKGAKSPDAGAVRPPATRSRTGSASRRRNRSNPRAPGKGRAR